MKRNIIFAVILTGILMMAFPAFAKPKKSEAKSAEVIITEEVSEKEASKVDEEASEDQVLAAEDTSLNLIPLTEDAVVCPLIPDEELNVLDSYADLSLESTIDNILLENVSEEDLTRQGMVELGLSCVGNRYVWGGESLTNGVDCSGFTMLIYREFGIDLPHSSAEQATMGITVTAEEMQPGDLLFYGSGGHVSHVAMYIGDGQIVHASNAQDGIKISDWNYNTPIAIKSFVS